MMVKQYKNRMILAIDLCDTLMMNKKINVVHGYLIGVAYIEHGPIFDS
jgi:hypothetical protein